MSDIILSVDQLRMQDSLVFYLPYNSFHREFITLVMSHTLQLVGDLKKIVTM